MKEKYEIEQMISVEKDLIDGNIKDAAKYIDSMIEELANMKAKIIAGVDYTAADVLTIRGQQNLMDVLKRMDKHKSNMMVLEWMKGGD